MYVYVLISMYMCYLCQCISALAILSCALVPRPPPPAAPPLPEEFTTPGDSRLELFTRMCPTKRVVNTVPQVDSQGHLQGLMVMSPSGRDLCNGQEEVDPRELETDE